MEHTRYPPICYVRFFDKKFWLSERTINPSWFFLDELIYSGKISLINIITNLFCFYKIHSVRFIVHESNFIQNTKHILSKTVSYIITLSTSLGFLTQPTHLPLLKYNILIRFVLQNPFFIRGYLHSMSFTLSSENILISSPSVWPSCF